MNRRAIVLAAILASALTACGGGGSSESAPAAAPTARSVTLSWEPNRESGVNSAGGGYQVAISDNTTTIEVIDVRYDAAAGVTPTTANASLYAGTYTATVRAYAALDAMGGTTGSYSAPSASVTIVVP